MPSLNRSSRSAKYKPNCLVPLLRCFQVLLRKLILEQVGGARACPATAGAVLALTLCMAVVAQPTTKSAGFNLRIPVGNALIANKFCVFCVFCVKQNIIGTQTSQKYRT